MEEEKKGGRLVAYNMPNYAVSINSSGHGIVDHEAGMTGYF